MSPGLLVSGVVPDVAWRLRFPHASSRKAGLMNTNTSGAAGFSRGGPSKRIF